MRTKLLLLALTMLPSVGCTHMNNTEQGAVSGGVLGTVAGALIGGPRGALVGAAVGTGAGALVGNAEDRRDDRRAATYAAVRADQARRQMTLQEIVQMTQQNVHEQVIVNQIITSGSVFNLTTDDVIYLQQQGVGNRVISEMQRAQPRAVIIDQRRPVYVYGPPPPPPPAFGVGVVVR